MATVEPYNLRWTARKDQMLVVSIGTGTSPKANQNLAPEDMNLIYNASSIPSALMFATLNEQGPPVPRVRRVPARRPTRP
jgi:hypothetical protein